MGLRTVCRPSCLLSGASKLRGEGATSSKILLERNKMGAVMWWLRLTIPDRRGICVLAVWDMSLFDQAADDLFMLGPLLVPLPL